MDTAGRRTTSQKVNKLTKSPTQCPMDIEPVWETGGGEGDTKRRKKTTSTSGTLPGREGGTKHRKKASCSSFTVATMQWSKWFDGATIQYFDLSMKSAVYEEKDHDKHQPMTSSCLRSDTTPILTWKWWLLIATVKDFVFYSMFMVHSPSSF